MKPQDMFIGARDFFAVLVPGAMFLILLPMDVAGWLGGKLAFGSGDDPSAGIVVLAFLAASYAVGTLISGVAGQFDKSVDRRIKDRIAKPPTGWSKLTRLEKDLARAQILAKGLEESINKQMIGLIENRPWSTRSFWWNYIRLKCPEGIMELDRLEGHQKLFRSLAFMSLLLGYIYALSPTYGGPPSIVETILAALAFCAFLVLYVRHRMVFGRRLYELAIVHTIPDSCVDEGAKAFFEAGQAWKALTET